MSAIRIHPEVAEALDRRTPVVALESAVITSGLPRDPLPKSSRLFGHGWKGSDPLNLELAQRMQQTVRERGAVPATVAVIQGDLCIGLDDDELVMLATEHCAEKASVTDLARIMSNKGFAGTTVSATLAACGLAQARIASHAGSTIRVFATGGIGGVHRHWQQRPDISADLRQIACTPVCVVCSGAKSILDLPATLEMLEALGVPIVGHKTDRFPQFFTAGDEKLRLANSVNDVAQAAAICRIHWDVLHNRAGILLAHPPPVEFAVQPDELESAIEQAEHNAAAHHVSGGARTPFLLAELARLTGGRSLDANLALLLNNAKLAAELATELSRQ